MDGGWGSGDDGRPQYRVPSDLPAPDGVDPWHLVGSPGLLALAHASGRVSLYATASGMARLADRTGGWTVDGRSPQQLTVTFGCGWAQWEGEVDGVVVRRRIEADDSAARLHLRWEVETDRPVELGERWEVRHLPLVAGALMSHRVPVPSTHRGAQRVVWVAAFTLSASVRRLTDGLRRGLGRVYPLRATAGAKPPVLRWEPVRRPRPPTRPAFLRRDLPTLELRPRSARARVSPQGVTHRAVPPGGGAPAVVELDLVLHEPPVRVPGAPARPGAERGPVAWDGSAEPPAPGAGRAPAAGGAPAVADPGLADVPAPLAAEATWHVAQLRGLRVPDAFAGHTFVMQGSAYAFVHGLHGAPRDEALVAVPLAVLDPPTARQSVLAIAAMVAPDGSLHYARTGFGRTVSGGVHAAPTDLPLFFAWALTEYVWATGDGALLDERPRPFGRVVAASGRPTVAELVASSVAWFLDSVGTGEHGLARVGSGDWADPISLMVADRRAFHRRGESAFNAGMACYVLPRVAALLDDRDPALAGRARAAADAQRDAMERAWTGEWYRRGWDGRGGAVGERHCFLDAQVWPLVAGIGGAARCRDLTATVGRLLDDPSPIGPTILDRPHHVRMGLLADGWDCNGGVWAALGGLAAWGTGLHDPARAWAMLHRMSFAGQAAAYPHTWFGRWSGPDARNAWFGDRPGGTFVHPATPMAEFPVMNSNAHAGPLLGLLRVAGVTVGPGGVERPAG